MGVRAPQTDLGIVLKYSFEEGQPGIGIGNNCVSPWGPRPDKHTVAHFFKALNILRYRVLILGLSYHPVVGRRGGGG